MNFSIRNKLFLASGIGTALIVLGALFGFWLAWQSILVFDEEVQARMADERRILATQVQFKQQVQEWKDVLLRGSDPAALEKYWANFEEAERGVQNEGDALRRSAMAPDARALVERFLSAHREMGARYRQGLQAFKDSHFEPRAGDVAVKGIDREPTQLLTAASKAVGELSDKAAKHAVDAGQRGIIISVVLMLVGGTIGGLVFAWLVERTIVAPAQRLAVCLDTLAQGDLGTAIPARSHDELGQVATSAERLRQDLGQVIMDIKHTVSRLAEASAQLASVTSTTRTTTEIQFAETSRIAAAIEQMAASVDEVGGSMSGAAEMAESADREAVEGRQVVANAVRAIDDLARQVGQVTDAIGELGGTSQDIGGVVSVIRSIADQTNLLALNAAIEAARAGEQGRGFAVVADEVRNLAQRTQDATREVQEKIDRLLAGTTEATSVTGTVNVQAKASAEQAQQAGKALERISRGIASITTMNRQIADAGRQQAASAHAVRENVGHITDAAERNARSLEQTTAASESVAAVASELSDLIKRFRA